MHRIIIIRSGGNLDEKLSDGEDIVVNTALPGKAPMLAFICPETQGSYRGFA